MDTSLKEEITNSITTMQSQLRAKDIIIERLKEQLENSVPSSAIEKWKQRYIGVVLAMSDSPDVDLGDLADELASLN